MLILLGGYSALLYGRGIGQAGSLLPVSMIGLAAAFWGYYALNCGKANKPTL